MWQWLKNALGIRSGGKPGEVQDWIYQAPPWADCVVRTQAASAALQRVGYKCKARFTGSGTVGQSHMECEWTSPDGKETGVIDTKWRT